MNHTSNYLLDLLKYVYINPFVDDVLTNIFIYKFFVKKEIHNMNITNNNFNKNYAQSFQGGLSKKLMQEINNTNVEAVSQKLQEAKIITDFQDNKAVAWCCHKVVEIINELNQKHKLNLSLPKGVFVENFDNLNVTDKTMYGFCNMQPSKLFKDTDLYVPSRTLFFNSFEGERFLANQKFYNWQNIDEISDFKFSNKSAPTDYFLDIFFHEFAHVIHEDNLIKTLGSNIVAEKLQQVEKLHQSNFYKSKYGKALSKICDYAQETPFEAVSCDMSKRLSNKIDKNKLQYNVNPLKGTPYDNQFFELLNTKLDNILRKFWKGKFE